MTADANKQPPVPPADTGARQSARTDDLLASGADAKDGARGFDSNADPHTLQTGMEGIADAAASQGNRQSDRAETAAQQQTLADKPGQARNK
jgi:hypothetical protein